MQIMVFKVKLVLVTLSFYVFFIYLEYVVGAKEKSCKTLTADMTKRQLGGINNCTKVLKFKNGKEKAQKASCILKCVLRNVLVLNSEYKLDDETIEAFITREFPAGEVAEKAMTELKGCHDTTGKDLNPDEDLCKSYDGFARCLAIGFTRVCG